MSVISVQTLRKHYGALEAVAGVDLEIEEGEVFALLGPNGAGKSTTVEILEGHRSRTSGDVTVLGFDPGQSGADFRSRIGIVLQAEAIEKELTVTEALDIYGRIYPKRMEPAALIDLVGLREKTDTRIRQLSGGQRRRLELALGLVGDPDLLFLDEPTTGFDPSARRQAWTVVDGLASLGKTILLTTHYMDEAQHLADRVAVIRQGVIVAEGTPDSLGDRMAADYRISFRLGELGPVELPPDIEISPGESGHVTTRTDDPRRTLHSLTGWALDRGVELENLKVSRPSLEEVYLDLVGEDSD